MVNSPFKRALSKIDGATWLDQVAAASVRAAEAQIYGQNQRTLLSISMTNRESVDAFDTALVLQAIQSAAGKIGHIKRHGTDVVQTQKIDREYAPLISLGQSGPTVYFTFPPPPVIEEDIFDFGPFQGPSELAVHELMQLLPQDGEDDRTLDAVLSQRIGYRSAINDVVRAVKRASSGLDLKLVIPNQEESFSVLTSDQADVLQESLMESAVDRRQIRQSGILDGMRTSRRVFYLEPDSGQDIYGSISDELLPAVRANIGKRVDIVVEASTVQLKSGQRSRVTYKLESITPQPMLPFGENDE